MDHYAVLAASAEDDVSDLAASILDSYAREAVTLLSGPRVGMVLVQVRDGAANSRFHAGEMLVTEVRLELAGQFGYGMVMGNAPRKALGIALVDAALRLEGPVATELRHHLAILEQNIVRDRQNFQRAVSTTRVNFDVF